MNLVQMILAMLTKLELGKVKYIFGIGDKGCLVKQDVSANVSSMIVPTYAAMLAIPPSTGAIIVLVETDSVNTPGPNTYVVHPNGTRMYHASISVV